MVCFSSCWFRKISVQDLLNMMFNVHKDKEEILLQLPQSKGQFGCSVKLFVKPAIADGRAVTIFV